MTEFLTYKVTNQPTNQLVPWDNIVILKLIVLQVIKKRPWFYWHEALVHKIMLPDPNRRKLNPARAFAPRTFHLNTILPCTNFDSKCHYCFPFPGKAFLTYARYICCLSYPPRPTYPITTIRNSLNKVAPDNLMITQTVKLPTLHTHRNFCPLSKNRATRSYSGQCESSPHAYTLNTSQFCTVRHL